MQALLLSTLSLNDDQVDADKTEANIEQSGTDGRNTETSEDVLSNISPSSNDSIDSIATPPVAPCDEYEAKKQEQQQKGAMAKMQHSQAKSTAKPERPSHGTSGGASVDRHRNRSNLHAGVGGTGQGPTTQPKNVREHKSSTKEVLPGDSR